MLNNPTRYVDPDGAAPVDAMAHALERASVVFGMVFAGKMRWVQTRNIFGHWFTGGFQTLPKTLYSTNAGVPPVDHVLFTGWRPKIPGVGSRSVVSLEKPVPLDPWPTHRGYHISWRGGPPKPAPNLGRATDFALQHGNKVRTGLLVVVIGLTAWNIYSAYEQDTAAGNGYAHTLETIAGESGAWGGAVLGCYAAGALGEQGGNLKAHSIQG